MAKESTCLECIIGLFFVVVVYLSNSGLATFHSEVTNPWYRVSWMQVDGLKESPNKPLIARFCLKLSLVNSSGQTHGWFERVKHSLFISVSHSLLSFESWVNLKVLTNRQNTLVFLWNLLWTWNQKSLEQRWNREWCLHRKWRSCIPFSQTHPQLLDAIHTCMIPLRLVM